MQSIETVVMAAHIYHLFRGAEDGAACHIPSCRYLPHDRLTGGINRTDIMAGPHKEGEAILSEGRGGLDEAIQVDIEGEVGTLWQWKGYAVNMLVCPTDRAGEKPCNVRFEFALIA